MRRSPFAVAVALLAVLACKHEASAGRSGPPWGVRVAQVPYSDIWRVEDRANTCYVIVNNNVNNSGASISCVHQGP
jgi:hypothetical protein